jgi:hypothetical protein
MSEHHRGESPPGKGATLMNGAPDGEKGDNI